MISRRTERFRQQLAVLPQHVRTKARESYLLWRENPSHPSLRFKPIKGLKDVWSARFTASYRAVRVRDGGKIVWFWIGTHADYEQLLATLRR